MVNGRYLCQNLAVEIKGQIPATLSQQGDKEFERSRARAQAALEKLESDIKTRVKAEGLVQKLHELRTGERIKTLQLDDAFAAWKALPRRKEVSGRYLVQVESIFLRFRSFLKRRYPRVQEMADVQTGMACDFMNVEAARRVTPKTYNNVLIFLRSFFEKLKKQAGMAENPFDGIPTREEDTVFRKPFTVAELPLILEAAQSDPLIRPIIVTGMCTAMRRGDCCLLDWSSVDLSNRFITVKTSKTGETVEIPIFPLLEAELRRLTPKGSGPVFPTQAKLYRQNPDGITTRVKAVLRAAGLDDEKGGAPAGQNVNRLRRASVRDFHSFRVTWVTLALTAGIPIELVQRVTGHRTSQIVLKHYFQPDKEDFRRSLADKLPALLSDGQSTTPTAIEKVVLDKLESMHPRNWRQVRNELMDLLKAV